MPTVTYRGHIRAAPEAVFDFVADAEHNPRWHAHVRETRWIDPPPTRVGRRGALVVAPLKRAAPPLRRRI